MVGVAARNLHQDITYWPPGVENEFGHASYGTPVLVKGRWQAKNQQIRRATGEEIVSSAEVFVDRDVAISGFLAVGNHTAQSSPVSDAREIQDFRTTPDLRNLESERRAYL